MLTLATDAVSIERHLELAEDELYADDSRFISKSARGSRGRCNAAKHSRSGVSTGFAGYLGASGRNDAQPGLFVSFVALPSSISSLPPSSVMAATSSASKKIGIDWPDELLGKMKPVGVCGTSGVVGHESDEIEKRFEDDDDTAESRLETVEVEVVRRRSRSNWSSSA